MTAEVPPIAFLSLEGQAPSGPRSENGDRHGFGWEKEPAWTK